MSRYVPKSSAQEFIIGTEVEMIYRLQKDNPGKMFYPASAQAGCPNMKKITLDKVLRSLETLQDEVKVAPEISRRARASIEAMLKYS